MYIPKNRNVLAITQKRVKAQGNETVTFKQICWKVQLPKRGGGKLDITQKKVS